MSASTLELAGAAPVTAGRVFIGRSLRHSLRDGEGLVMAIALPVLLMLLFTLVFGGAIQDDGSYIDYVVPGIVLLCSGFGAASVAVSVSRDMTAGAMRRFRSMPIVAAMSLAGHVVASLLRNLAATGVVIGVSLAVGFRPSASAVEGLVALGLVALWILAITTLFAFVGVVAGSPEAANAYGFGLLFLPYVSSAFVPVSTMPEWLQPIAAHQPITPLTESLRALLTGGDPGLQPLAALAWCIGIALGGVLLIAWRFPRTAAV